MAPTSRPGGAKTSEQPGLRDRGMKWACRSGSAAAIRVAVLLGASVSAVPVGSVAAALAASRPIGLVGATEASLSATGDAVIVKALTLQLAAKARQVDAFALLVSLGARLDEPGTSLASIRALIGLVTQGCDAPALQRLFFPAGASAPRLASQLGHDMLDEMLVALLEGYYTPPGTRPPASDVSTPDECLGFARALLDAGANPNLFRSFQRRSTSMLSAAVKTRLPDLVRLLLDRGATPDGPPGLQPPPLADTPFQIPLCAIADLLLDHGADINVSVPYFQRHRWHISFTTPLLVFLDTVDCWDDDGNRGRHALGALRFLLDRGSNPDGPPIHPGFESWSEPMNPSRVYSVLLRSGRFSFGTARVDPVRDLLDKWGVGKLASPVFMSALELLAAHPDRRGGVVTVADDLAKHEYTVRRPSPSSSSPSTDAVVDAWTGLISLIIRHLTPHEMGEFLHAYIVRTGTCRRTPRKSLFVTPSHCAQHEISGLARATVRVLLAAGADINYRLSMHDSWLYHRDPNCEYTNKDGPEYGLTALHAICVWLAGRAWEEEPLGSWQPTCRGFRHTPSRAAFLRFLVEECGADTGARYLGRTPAEALVQFRRPELDATEIDEEERRPWIRVWGAEHEAVEEGRRALLEVLGNVSSTT
ncbi:hypothetical protein C8A05DRAFT_19909 [Staphylotrichum tortipilum]|uniref:Ankyrin repeat protein n=1 Tax=Staphylotrichum tortipilum TaxID=2831512 RepID=A0AAN6RN38_9PEZI|nr:hypothetical protein C8A05DRAFT_19909 [Staphylotrichum longicolle]